MGVLANIGVQFDFLNVFEQVFSDFSLTDFYYSNIRDKDNVASEDRVVLVNIGNLPREGIAEQINILNKYNPKVIGIDAFFIADRDPGQDSSLRAAIQGTKNFVMVSAVREHDEKTDTWGNLEVSNQKFVSVSHTGFANIKTDDEEDESFVTWRDFSPKEKLKSGAEEIAFAAKVASFYDSTKVEKFLQRGNKEENIYFKGNLDKYIKLDVDDVFAENFTPELLEGKIVLMGYMGNGYTDTHWDEDKFYSPLNARQVGRTYPDIYGVVVHANIVSMILDENTINEMQPIFSVLVAFIVCFFNVALFSWISSNEALGIWYDVLTKLIQLVEVIALVFIVVILFSKFHYKAELSYTTFAVLLCGDVTEVYLGFVKQSFLKLTNLVAKKNVINE